MAQPSSVEEGEAELAALEAELAAKRAAMKSRPAIPAATNVIPPQPVAAASTQGEGDWNPEEDLTDIFG